MSDPRELGLLKTVNAAARRIKLFPLPDVALFPSHGLPLHVFEQRYRDLTVDALGGDGVLALPQLQANAMLPSPGTSPEIVSIFGVGVVAEHERLPDGKFNVLVRGVARARLVRELPPHSSYREAEVEILTEDPDGVTVADASVLAACLVELGRRLSPETAVALGQLAALQREPGRLADLSAAALLPPQLHQSVLDELNVRRRLAFVTDRVADLLLSIRPPRGSLLN
jgi:Lon protease-like protein